MTGVGRVPPFDRTATYDDLVALQEPLVAEIVDGELHASPRPGIRRARAASVLGALVLPPMWEGRGGPGGWWILAEPELHLQRDVLVPDLAGWRRSRMPRLPDGAFFTDAPDWICEVVSPSTAALDRVTKLGVYARESVPCAWLLDPIARTFEVLRLETGR
jgi:Uma2 family endonuclease